MAVNLNRTIREHMKSGIPLDPAAPFTSLERGQLLHISGYNSAGRAMVAPTAGAADEKVVGFLWLSTTQQAEATKLEALSIPPLAPLTITLGKTPSAVAEMHAYNADTLAAIVIVAGLPAAGQLGLTGKVLTADAALAGFDVVVVYKYAISAAELARRGGQRSVNQGGEDSFGQVTVAYGQCEVTCSNFDTAGAWEDVTNLDVFAGPNGTYALAGNVQVGHKTHAPRNLLTPGIEQAFVTVDCNFPGIS